MKAVNVAGTFKKDQRELNGLESIAQELIDSPLERRVVAALVETRRVVKDFADGGSERVVTGIVHIEPLTGDAATDTRKHLDEAFRARTGRDDSPADTLFDGPQAKE